MRRLVWRGGIALGLFIAFAPPVSEAAADLFEEAVADRREGRQGAALSKMLLFVSASPEDRRTDEALRVIWSIAHAAKDAESSLSLDPERWRGTVKKAKAVLEERRLRAERLLGELDTLSASLSRSSATLASLRETSLTPDEFDLSRMDELSRLRAENRLREIRGSLKRIVDDPSASPEGMHEAQGYFWLYQGDLELAVKEWREATRLNPGNAALRARLDSLEARWESQNRKEEADHETLLGIGDFKAGQYERAVSRLSRALEFSPDDPEARRYLALARSASDAASKQARVQALMIEGRKQYEGGRLLDAVQSWVDILSVDPSNAEARRFLERTRTRLTVKQGEPAPPSSRPAKQELSREKAEDSYSLGLIQYADGDLEGAVASFTRAVRWWPELKKAQKGLDQAQAELRKR